MQATTHPPAQARVAEALRFLSLLGKAPEQTHFRTIRHGKGANRSRRGADLLGFDPDVLLADNASGSSVYVVVGNATSATKINPRTGKPTGAVQDSDCPTINAAYVEWDDRPIEWQVRAWQEHGLPEPSALVLSGGKSVHAYWVFTEPMPADQWRVIQARLIEHCGSDPTCKNPSRLMRLPGFEYIDKQTGNGTGRYAELLHTSGARYTPEQIEACLPAPAEQQAAAPSPAPVRPVQRGDLPPRTIQEIEVAARHIPRRVVGGGTYEPSRNALCGCAAALAEAGHPDPDGHALALLADRWPDHGTAAQVLESATTREAASFWAIAREHGYDLRRGASTAGNTISRRQTAAPPVTPATFIELIQSLPDGWAEQKEGPPAPSRLSVGELAGMLQRQSERLRFNEMTLLAEVETTTGWCSIVDADMDSAYVVLSQKGWIIGADPIVKAVCHVARLRKFHPVRQYLLDLEQNASIAPFDLDKVAPQIFCAASPLHTAMVRKWLIGAVARALDPGCQMDYCLVLQSRKQGIHKSTSLCDLASPDWFTSTVPEQDKDFLLNVHSCWIFELAELESVTGRRESGRIKNLITTRVDMFRQPYGRSAERMKRGSVFCGTVNEETFLRDETGNRRFWVVPINGENPIDRDAIRSARDGIWKAALLAYRSGELPMLPKELAAESEQQNEQFTQEDPWLAMLQAWMDGNPLGAHLAHESQIALADPAQPFSTAEALHAAGVKRLDQITRSDETRVAPLLRQLGFEKDRQIRRDGKRVRLWSPVTTVTTCHNPPTHEVVTPKPTALQSVSAPVTTVTTYSAKREAGSSGDALRGRGSADTFFLERGGCDTPPNQAKPTAPELVSASQPPPSQPLAGCDTSREPETHPHWLPKLLAIRDANPGQPAAVFSNQLMAQHGIDVPGRRVAQLLKAWDARAA